MYYQTAIAKKKESAARNIRYAWIAAVFSGIVTAAIALSGILPGGLFHLIDATLLLGLAYGIYRKSRISSIAILLYWSSNFILLAGSGLFAPLLMQIAFGILYLKGAMGTFTHHSILRAEEGPEGFFGPV